MTSSFSEFKTLYSKIVNISEATSLLFWDQLTYMPEGGSSARAEQAATLQSITHELSTGSEMRDLLHKCEAEYSNEDENSDTRKVLRIARRDFDRGTRLPGSLVEEKSRHSTLAYNTWVKARERSDFDMFAPVLKKTLELTKQEIDLIGYKHHPYDALLEESEPGITHAQVKAVFSELKPALISLISRIKESGNSVDVSCLYGDYNTEKQKALTTFAVNEIGYNFANGRQDSTVHPFCISMSPQDVRITTRYDAGFISAAFYASMHEAGHALYEQGLPLQYTGTPLCRAASSGVHESQSRLWENIVGRSREYCTHIMPKFREYFPSFSNCDPEELYRAVNCVQPSFIRVEADEATYNLHVLLRFEIESALLEGNLDVDDIPDAWDSAMEEYFGITPPSDSEGCLQDVHWTGGFGGFPCYTLGNVISLQLWEKLRTEITEPKQLILNGEFAPILQWLRENVHTQGMRYQPLDLVETITGTKLSAKPLIDYLNNKYSEIYGI